MRLANQSLNCTNVKKLSFCLFTISPQQLIVDQSAFSIFPSTNQNKRQSKVITNFENMKNLPLDVILLRLGLNYAQLRASNSECGHLFVQKPEEKANNSKKYHNLTFLHAKVRNQFWNFRISYLLSFLSK